MTPAPEVSGLLWISGSDLANSDLKKEEKCSSTVLQTKFFQFARVFRWLICLLFWKSRIISNLRPGPPQNQSLNLSVHGWMIIIYAKFSVAILNSNHIFPVKINRHKKTSNINHSSINRIQIQNHCTLYKWPFEFKIGNQSADPNFIEITRFKVSTICFVANSWFCRRMNCKKAQTENIVTQSNRLA